MVLLLNRSLAACCALVLVAFGIGPVGAAEVEVTGAAGAAGADAAQTSQPGGAGGDGADAGADAGPNVDTANLAGATGGAGGTGGRGGPGPGGFIGGPGGSGGRGGHAVAAAVTSVAQGPATSEARAQGGRGGEGGVRGSGSGAQSIRAPGGSGGVGGNATAAAVATATGANDAAASAFAVGGHAGMAGNGNIVGSGGGVATANAAAFADNGSAGVMASVTGGNGGGAALDFCSACPSGGSGGDGAAASLTSLNVTGRATQVLSFALLASGGHGGTLQAPGRGGNGGNATIDFSFTDNVAASLTASGVARAGSGGMQTGYSGTQGRAGDAVSMVALTSLRPGADVKAFSSAVGQASMFSTQGGAATSHASAIGLTSAQAQARAQTTGGQSPTIGFGFTPRAIDATSTGSARAALSVASAQSVTRQNVSFPPSTLLVVNGIAADASSQGGGAAMSYTQTSFGARYFSLPALGSAGSPQGAFSVAYALADAQWLTDSLAGNPTVGAAIGRAVAGAGAMGASMSAGATGSRVDSASAAYELHFNSPAELAIGFLGFTGRDDGAALDMTFTASVSGAIVASQAFTSFASAAAYFTDHVVGLGSVNGDVDVLVAMSMNSSGDQAVGFSYLVAVVPEPSMGILLILGLGVLLLVTRRPHPNASGARMDI